MAKAVKNTLMIEELFFPIKITAPEKRTQKTINKLQTIAGRVLKK